MDGERRRLGWGNVVSIVCWCVDIVQGPPSSTSNDGVRVRLAQGSVAVSGAAGERRAARWASSCVQELLSARPRPVVARSAIGAA